MVAIASLADFTKSAGMLLPEPPFSAALEILTASLESAAASALSASGFSIPAVEVASSARGEMPIPAASSPAAGVGATEPSGAGAATRLVERWDFKRKPKAKGGAFAFDRLKD